MGMKIMTKKLSVLTVCCCDCRCLKIDIRSYLLASLTDSRIRVMANAVFTVAIEKPEEMEWLRDARVSIS